MTRRFDSVVNLVFMILGAVTIPASARRHLVVGPSRADRIIWPAGHLEHLARKICAVVKRPRHVVCDLWGRLWNGNLHQHMKRGASWKRSGLSAQKWAPSISKKTVCAKAATL